MNHYVKFRKSANWGIKLNDSYLDKTCNIYYNTGLI